MWGKDLDFRDSIKMENSCLEQDGLELFQKRPVLFSIQGWQSVDAEGQLYALICFHTRDLSISRFWYLLGSWKQLYMDTKGSQNQGVSKLYTDFLLNRDLRPWLPCYSRSTILSSRRISEEAGGQHCLPPRQFCNSLFNLWKSLPWAKNLKDPYSLVFISYYWYFCKRRNRKEANNLWKKHQLSSWSLRNLVAN